MVLRLLVFGEAGQVATSIRSHAQKKFDVISLGRNACDVADRASVVEAVKHYEPFTVVNAAAYTAVDKAEEDREAAFSVNADGAGHVAEAAKLLGIPVIHFSTDYVYPGTQEEPYIETDQTGPSGVYGQSKLEGEKQVIAKNPDHIILRTAWVYSKTGNNFLKTMLRLAAERDVLTIVDDQSGNPSHSDDLANGVFAAAAKLSQPHSSDIMGIYHLCGPERMTWADFARKIMQVSGVAGGPSAEIKNITTQEFPTPTKRPKNSSLNCEKFKKAFDFEQVDFGSSVKQTVTALLENV